MPAIQSYPFFCLKMRVVVYFNVKAQYIIIYVHIQIQNSQNIWNSLTAYMDI